MKNSALSRANSKLREALDAARARKHQRRGAPSTLEFAQALGLALDPWQTEVLAGGWSRALLNVTRQGGKSTVAALLGLHEARYRPGSLTLIVSPSDRQSGELFRKMLELRERLPDRLPLLDDTKRTMTFAGGGRVVSLPGSEGTIRGYSAVTLLIEDEAARVPDSLYLAIRPMLATTRGRLLLLSTPWGARGHFHREWTEGEGWLKVQVTAHQIPRISAEFLVEERIALGDLWFRQEYMTEFANAIDSVFMEDAIQAALTDDVKPLFLGGRP
jgi:hypothetical protein